MNLKSLLRPCEMVLRSVIDMDEAKKNYMARARSPKSLQWTEQMVLKPAITTVDAEYTS